MFSAAAARKDAAAVWFTAQLLAENAPAAVMFFDHGRGRAPV